MPAEGRERLGAEELEGEVEGLRRAHDPDAFVEAVRELADGLSPEERDLPGGILLRRSGTFERAADERRRAGGWLRRLWRHPTERRRTRG